VSTFSLEQVSSFTRAIQAKCWDVDYSHTLESPLRYVNTWLRSTAKLTGFGYGNIGKFQRNSHCFKCFHCKTNSDYIALFCFRCCEEFASLPAEKQHWLFYCFEVAMKYCCCEIVWTDKPEVRESKLDLGDIQDRLEWKSFTL
jgi:hypothetical protein